MDPVIMTLLVLFVLAVSAFSYGYYGAPVGGVPAPWVTPVGTLAVMLVIAFVIMAMTGWRLGRPDVPPEPARPFIAN